MSIRRSRFDDGREAPPMPGYRREGPLDPAARHGQMHDRTPYEPRGHSAHDKCAFCEPQKVADSPADLSSPRRCAQATRRLALARACVQQRVVSSGQQTRLLASSLVFCRQTSAKRATVGPTRRTSAATAERWPCSSSVFARASLRAFFRSWRRQRRPATQAAARERCVRVVHDASAEESKVRSPCRTLECERQVGASRRDLSLLDWS